MEQTYQRRILVRRDRGAIAVDLEDNFHRFEVLLGLRGDEVSAVTGTARRVPWATCPGALVALQDLNGHDPRTPFVIDRESKATRHCTHLFDMAMLALDHLRLGIPSRDYRVSADGPRERERITLAVDGRRVRTWELYGNRFVTPNEWRGHEVAKLRTLLSEDADPVAFLEQMVMRRAVHISRGRFLDQDSWETAADLDAAPTCISFQPGIKASAVRIRGSARDFTGR
jgi:hypothetical protein